ncbi:hypothetical protein FACS1894170_01970 [Planctomycetales bacterium]|nr:hypothetical protein FACS1894170_01970 [Planctomycetales bacterium]
MHTWLGNELDKMHTNRGTKLNVLAPRGSAKSTVASLAFPLREALEKQEPYIWILSDTMEQAQTHLSNIKNELLDNTALAEQYCDAVGKGSTWRNGAITLRNSCVIEAFGTGQQLRGRRRRENRPTLIICDDLQNDLHIVSASARERDRHWFHATVLKAGTETTNVIHLATALHSQAIGVELQDAPGWSSRRFQSIESYPLRMDLWKDWEAIYCNKTNVNAVKEAEAFYKENQSAMDAGAEVLWCEREPLYALMKMRTESGYSVFEREKQNSPVNPALCEFPEEYFEDVMCSRLRRDDGAVSVLALDPSKGTDSRYGDYSAYVFVTGTSDGLIYVNSWLERKPLSEMIRRGVELYTKYKPTVFAVETNQFQVLLQEEFERQEVPVFPLNNTLNKKIRIRRLEPLLSQRKFRFCDTASCRLLLEQLRMFPVGDHDDGPDALEMAVRVFADLASNE